MSNKYLSASVYECRTVLLFSEEVEHPEHRQLDVPILIQAGRNTATGPGVADDSDVDDKDKDEDDGESSSFSESSDDESERTDRSKFFRIFTIS